MTTFKSFLLAAAVATVALASLPLTRAESPTLAAVRQRDRLTVGSEMVFPTLNFKNPTTGVNEGFMADLARALAKQILGDEKKIEFRHTEDETRFEDVRDGAFDLLIDTTPASGEKLKLADFSDESFRSGSALLVRKGSPIRSIDDIKAGTRVAFVTANPDVKGIKAKAPGATYLEFENSPAAFAAVREGRADVFTQVVTHLYRAASQDHDYTVVGRFTTKSYRIAYRKGDTELGEYLNAFLKKFRDSGDYDRLFDKWFAAYGGANVR
jgi:aspartate/glutamate/glutamine transport system substrate-binding protein